MSWPCQYLPPFSLCPPPFVRSEAADHQLTARGRIPEGSRRGRVSGALSGRRRAAGLRLQAGAPPSDNSSRANHARL
eukprot:2919964-Rhodomonas_salina.1